MKVTLEQLKNLVQAGQNISLTNNLTSNGMVLIGKEKVLSSQDVDRLFQKMNNDKIEIKFVEGNFVSPEIKKYILAEIKNIFSKHPYYKKMPVSKCKQIDKVIENLLPHSDYISFALNHILSFSKKLFIHSVNVAIISLIIDLAWQKRHNKGLIDGLKHEIVFFGALLHDIGYLTIDKNIWELKRKDKDFKKNKDFKNHPSNGYELLKRDTPKHEFLEEILKIVLKHEERINESGFPMGLMAKQIDLSSQIVGLANEFEHLLNGELTDKTRGFTDISRYLMAKKGLFDKNCLNVLIEEFRYLE